MKIALLFTNCWKSWAYENNF